MCGGSGIADGACDCDGNILDGVAFVAVMASLKVLATATATSLTSVACAEEAALLMALVTATATLSMLCGVCGGDGSSCAGIGVAISACSSFTSGSAAAWPFVLTATTIADGASSQEAQTMVINVTSLPAGAQYQCSRPQRMVVLSSATPEPRLGQNTVTVAAVGFDRAVKFQFSDGDVGDFLAINDEERDDATRWIQERPFHKCNQFGAGPNGNWPHV